MIEEKYTAVIKESGVLLETILKEIILDYCRRLPYKSRSAINDLEVNMGKSFTLTKGFDKMVEKITLAVVADPLLRRQALAAVSMVLDQKNSRSVNIKNG